MFLLAWLFLQQPPATAAGLQWHGAAVHPGCIRQLTTDIADPRPVVAAVDLEGCSRSNRFSDAPDADGRILRWHPPGDDRASFQYEVVGALSNGLQVIRTGESGGGSGFFMELLWVRIVSSSVIEDGKPRTRDALTMAGTESLGDRDQVTIAIAGDTVTIKRREFRGARGYGPEKTTVRLVK